MKRFLLFGFDQHYPNGGWDDFVGSFESEQEAWEFSQTHKGSYTHMKLDYYHIVDTAKNKITKTINY